MTQRSVTDEQYGQLWRRLKEVARRVDEGTIQFAETMDMLQNFVIEPKLPDINAVHTLSVELVAGVSLDQLIREGFYTDWDQVIGRPEDYFDDYPIERSRSEIATLIQLDLPASRNCVIRCLRRNGLRPLSGRELLCLGRSNRFLSNKTRKPILAVGSNWWYGRYQSQRFLELSVFLGRRYLKLVAEPDGGWPTDYLFAGFPSTGFLR